GWFTAAAGPQRLYIGGRVRGFMNGGDPDGVSTWQIPAEATAVEGRMELNAELPMAPSGWRVREALSYDLPYLWPAEYETAVKRFEGATPEERDAFLRRAGVRWCVLPRDRQGFGEQAPTPPWRAVAEVGDWNMRVFECHPDASRLAFVPETRHLEAMFDPARPDGHPLGGARLDGVDRSDRPASRHPRPARLLRSVLARRHRWRAGPGSPRRRPLSRRRPAPRPPRDTVLVPATRVLCGS